MYSKKDVVELFEKLEMDKATFQKQNASKTFSLTEWLNENNLTPKSSTKAHTFDWYNKPYTLKEFLIEMIERITISGTDDGKRLMGDSSWKGEFMLKLAQAGIIDAELEPCCEDFSRCGGKPCGYELVNEIDAGQQFSKLLHKTIQ